MNDLCDGHEHHDFGMTLRGLELDDTETNHE